LYNFNRPFVEAYKMNRIRELRLQNGWRQQDLAARLNTNQQTVGRYETGTRGLDVETILKLCEIFGCSADYLLGRSALPSPELSEEETELMLAFRRADDRSREMVRLALAPFTAAATTAESAK
jgi:transcriptional regulator with XRE-family HTH domain